MFSLKVRFNIKILKTSYLQSLWLTFLKLKLARFMIHLFEFIKKTIVPTNISAIQFKEYKRQSKTEKHPDDVLKKMSCKCVLKKTSWKISWRRYEKVLKTSCEDVLKTSWRRLQEFFGRGLTNTSWRRLRRWKIVTLKTSSKNFYNVLEKRNGCWVMKNKYLSNKFYLIFLHDVSGNLKI